MKYISKASLKLPKPLKEVVWKLLKKTTGETQNLCIPGFIIDGNDIFGIEKRN